MRAFRAACLAAASLLAAVFASHCFPQPPGVPISPAAPFRLNEIAPLPETEGGPVWAELYNWGEAEASLAGWCLSDATGVYSFPLDVPSVPPEGVLLVVFGPEGSQVARLGPDARPVLRVSDRPQFMRGTDNELALYRTPEPTPDSIVDFVCWGRSSGAEQARWAEAAGILAAPAIGTDPESWGMALRPGASVGRINHAWLDPDGKPHRGEGWLGYTPGTPASANPVPPPVPVGPLQQQRRQAVGMSDFSALWLGWPPGFGGTVRTRFQVATDADFTKLVIDVAGPAPYAHKPPLPEGDYYWRARIEGPGFETAWTETIAYHEEEPLPEPTGPPPPFDPGVPQHHTPPPWARR